jgi:hypothetical protein
MNKTIAAALGATVIALGAAGVAWGEHDDDEREGHRGHDRRSPRDALSPVVNDRYRTECGGCHLAYQPGLLSAADWGRVMGTLDHHFGDDASLEPAVADELLAYLQGHAADATGRGGRTAAPGKAGAPPRITRTAYFERKHDEVPARYVTGNPQVGSFSNCLACHSGAAQANFNEHEVNIPGVGRFED